MQENNIFLRTLSETFLNNSDRVCSRKILYTLPSLHVRGTLEMLEQVVMMYQT